MNDTHDANIFEKIAQYWSEELNNEVYFQGELSQYKRGSRAYFDHIIQSRRKYLYYFDKIIQYFQQGQPPSSELTFLEIGCGMGVDLLQFAEAGFQCYGIDLADKHIELAKQAFREYQQQAVIQKGNAEDLDFPDEHFDRVFSFGVIHHTQNPEKAITEIYRVMKPGAKGCVMLYHKYSLNNLVHILLRIPYENPKGTNKVARDAHFVYKYSKADIYRMFKNFRHVTIQTEYVFGAGWGKVYDMTPKSLYQALSKILGWHLLIFFTK